MNNTYSIVAEQAATTFIVSTASFAASAKGMAAIPQGIWSNFAESDLQQDGPHERCIRIWPELASSLDSLKGRGW